MTRKEVISLSLVQTIKSHYSGQGTFETVIIMISGKKGNGKTTLALALEAIIKDSQILTFAKPIKDYVDGLYPLGTPKEIKRSFYQKIGDATRDICGKNIFADKMVNEISSCNKPQVFIIDDWRFNNEFEILNKIPNSIILTIRLNTVDNNSDNHLSEVDLDSFKDYDIILKSFEDINNFIKEVRYEFTRY